MSNSSTSSQESNLIISETHAPISIKSDSIDLNMNNEKPEAMNYTYHKHSCPKNIIYYRCSDKKCPARVQFDPSTKKFTLKNSHISSKFHKEPIFKKNISSDDLINSPASNFKGPLVISQSYIDTQDQQASEIKIPNKRKFSNDCSEISSSTMFLIRINIFSDLNFQKFCNGLIEKCIVDQIFFLIEGKKFIRSGQESVRNIIEIYILSQFIGKALLYINNYFGKAAEVTLFKKD